MTKAVDYRLDKPGKRCRIDVVARAAKLSDRNRMAKPKETNKKKKTVVRSPKPTKISFEYLKSAHHRVVLVTGATGGPTPNAKLICMTTVATSEIQNTIPGT